SGENEQKKKRYEGQLSFISKFSIITFLLGIVAVALFVGLNLKQIGDNGMAEDEKTEQRPVPTPEQRSAVERHAERSGGFSKDPERIIEGGRGHEIDKYFLDDPLPPPPSEDSNKPTQQQTNDE